MTVGLPLAIVAPPRADLLVVLESRGRLGDGSRVPQPGERQAHHGQSTHVPCPK